MYRRWNNTNNNFYYSNYYNNDNNNENNIIKLDVPHSFVALGAECFKHNILFSYLIRFVMIFLTLNLLFFIMKTFLFGVDSAHVTYIFTFYEEVSYTYVAFTS